MPHKPHTRHDWHDAFAALYAEHTHCSRTDARYISRMLHPVLGQLSPEEALQTVVSHPSFIGDWGGPQQPQRANGKPRS
ncbi:MAG TPA: hypothetical protein VJO99_08260 [Burkholderiaceae bacterium]|nr:hypothetical protein [Burkholderiaceae bacterium]